MNQHLKRLFRLLGYGLLLLVGLLVLGIGWLYWYSDGTTAPILDARGEPVAGSVATLEAIQLNGAKQWILTRTYDRTKPVLLFVHGGPGSPELPIMTDNEALEKRFVVVNWDQRGAGKSYDPAVFDSTFTLDTFIQDAAQLSRLLAKRFNQPKIYIMGHSWGTLLSYLTVQKHPDLFYAYMGIGQVADQTTGEQLSYDWVLQQARKHQNSKQIDFLTNHGRPPYATTKTWMDYLLRQRDLVAEYGGSMYGGSLVKLLVKRLLLAKEYTLADKMNYLVGALASLEKLWPVVVSTNLNKDTPRLNVPVVIFQGTHDYQTPYRVAKIFFDKLEAPQKKLFTFTQSAHAPNLEESALFMSRLDSVTTLLAH